MTRVNKVIALFLLIVGILIVSSWRFLQSEKFASFLSQKIEKSVKEKLESDLKFSKLTFSFLPLGVSLKDISFVGKDLKKLPIVNVKNIFVSFSTLDLLFNKLCINDILIDSGTVDFQLDLHSESDFKLKDFIKQIKKKEIREENNIINIYNDFFNKLLPINIKHIAFKDISLNLVDLKLYLASASLELSKNQKKISLDVQKLQLPFLNKDTKKNVGQNDYVLEQVLLGINLDTSRQNIKISDLEVKKGLQSLKFNYQLNLDKNHFTDSQGNGDLDSVIDFEKLAKDLDLNKYVKTKNGMIIAKGTIYGPFLDPDFEINLKISDLDIEYAKVKNIEGTLKKNQNSINIEKLVLWQNDEKAVLKQAIPLFDLKTKTLLPKEIKLLANKLSLKTALHVVPSVSEALDASLNGEVGISYKNMNLVINASEVIEANNLSVDIKNKDKSSLHLLDIKKLFLKKTKFSINLDKVTVDFDLESFTKNKESEVVVKGRIDSEGLDIKSLKSRVNLDEFGDKILGIYLKGKGDLSFHVAGKFKDNNILFNFKTDLFNGNIFRFSLGRVKSVFSLDLNKMILNIKPSEGEYKNTKYFVEGFTDFKKDIVNIDLNSSAATYEDLREMLAYFLVDAEKIAPQNVEGFLSLDASIRGGIKVQDLDVRGGFDSGSISINGEDFSSFSGDIRFLKNKLSFNNLLLKKEGGHLSGYFNKVLGTPEYDYKFLVSNIFLSKMNLYNQYGFGLKGKVNGHAQFSKDHTIKGSANLTLTNTTINDIKIADSRLQVKAEDDRVQLDAQLIENVFVFKSILDLKNKKEKKSSLSFDIQTNDFALIASIISPHNMNDLSIKGNISCSFKSRFSMEDYLAMDLEFLMDDFYIMKNNFSLGLYRNKNSFLVENGIIKNWDIQLEGDGGSFKSQGSGNLSKNFSIKNFLNFDSGILEIFTSKIISSSGKIENKFFISGQDSKISYLAELNAKDASLAYLGLPGNFENVESHLLFEKDILSIDKFKGKFARGNFSGNGKIVFDKKFPKIDFNFLFNDANISYFKRSNFILSGKGVVDGNAPPYNLKGELTLLSAMVQDEFDDMKKETYGSKKIDNKFIPKEKKKNSKQDFMAFDLIINPISSVYVKNSLVQLGFGGKLHLRGTESVPKLSGSLSLIPGSGKVFFKDNDFVLSRGDIYFYQEDESILPEFNIEGLSRISNYDVVFNLTGRSNSLNVELSSNPSLPRKDILSLLALGFTDDVSKSLSANDRMSLTQAGIGSVILNRLKLDEKLKSSLGLNLSLSPEITEDSSEPSVLNTEGGRMRSATRLQVQKKLNKRTELIGATTVGGTGNKKSMNLNYSINKRLSLDGVYEQTQPTTQTASEKDNSSAGGDLKFKWTFK